MRPTDLAQTIQAYLKVEVSIFRFNPHAIRGVLAAIRAELIDRVESAGASLRLPEDDGGREDEIVQLKPSIYGIGVDLKAIWRRVSGRRA